MLSSLSHIHHVRHTSNYRGVGYAQLPESHTNVCSSGYLRLPATYNSNYLGHLLTYL